MKTSYSEQDPGPRVDWGDALAVPNFYGRKEEQAQLSQWIVQEDCRVVGVLGMGGIGKSALSINLTHQLIAGTDKHVETVPTKYVGTVPCACPFEIIIFRSLRDAPSCEVLLDDCLQTLSPQPLSARPSTLEQRFSLLLEHIHRVRVLLVLDNLECLLQEGNVRGQFRPGYEEYGQLLRRMVETVHQSCLLFTSREKPAELRPLESRYPSVRSLRLTGLDVATCQQFFVEKAVTGSQPEQERLIEIYAGNPLALKIVAETIVDQFAGQIGQFLASQSPVIFAGITDLLNEQFARLSTLEQTVLCWLAIMREPATLDDLLALLILPLPRRQVLLEAIDALHRRSLVESGKHAGSFTLQSVILEYVTAILIEEGSREIKLRQLDRLIQYGLSQAHAKEYVRQTQERLLITPLLAELQSTYPSQVEIEEQLLGLLDKLREEEDSAQGYGPTNLIALLRLLRGNLKGFDLSQLCIRGAYLQGIEMQDASLAGTTLHDTVWTSAFDVIRAVAVSCDGKLWATGSLQGKVRVWDEGTQTLHLIWQAHTDVVATLAFSPDGRTLASGSYDGTVKLWDLEQGILLWTGWHTDVVQSVAFAPDGRMLASCGTEAVIRLWEVTSGTNLQTLSGQDGVFFSLAWSPDNSLLASGSWNGNIQLWRLQGTQPATCIATLTGHTTWVYGLAFAPNGTQLASASWDRTVKLWEVESPHLLQTLTGHTERVFAVAWSRDGRVMASAGFDNTICVFDVERSSYRAVLYGHTAFVYSIAFTSNSHLLSGSEDGTLRVWDVTNGQCMRIIEGNADSLYDVAWNPDSTRLASASTDTLVTIWDVTGRTQPKVLRGHSWHIFGVMWSPDGQMLASSGRDNAIRLWDPATGECRQTLRDPDYVDTMFYGVAWSPNGRLLASGTYMRGVYVWDMVTRTRRWVGLHRACIRRVAWSPDGTRLANSGDDGNVCLWEASDGTLLGKLQGHSGRVMNVDWSPDGTRLASAGEGKDGGELLVWNMESQKASTPGELVQTLKGHPGSVFAVAWSPTGEVLVSGGSDGTIRWWEVSSGDCLRMCKGHEGGVRSLRVSPDGRLLASSGNDNTIRVWDLKSGELLRTLRHDRPYERLNITGIRGLNEAQRASLLALGAIEEVGP